MSPSLLKKLVLSVGVLGVLWVIYIVRQVPRDKTPFTRALESAHEIQIQRANQSVTFIKQESQWHVKLPNGKLVLADEMKFPVLLSSLREVHLEDVISDRHDRLADFEIDDTSGTVIRMMNGQGQELAAGVFGKQSSNYTQIFYRAPKSDEVYLARGLYAGELGVPDAQAWRSRQLVNIPDPEVKEIHIAGKGIQSDWVRVSTTAWSLNGKPAPVESANLLVGKLAHFGADSFLSDLDAPLTFDQLTFAQITVVGEKSQADLRIGPLDKKAPRYPLSSGPENGIVWVSQATIESILKFKP